MDSKKVTQNMQLLLQQLDSRGDITTEQAMELLHISESTARRLFTRLAQHGCARRTFGGICRAAQQEEYNFDTLSVCNTGAKQGIALAAAALVASRDVLYLDGGTTLAPFAKELARRISQGEVQGVVIFTNSLSTLNALQGVEGVTLLGGRFRTHRQDFCGHIAECAVQQLHFTKSFLGTDAVEADRGFSTTDFETAQLNRLVLQAADKNYVLADASKFGRTSLTPYAAPGSNVNVVTEEALPPEVRTAYIAAGFHFL